MLVEKLQGLTLKKEENSPYKAQLTLEEQEWLNSFEAGEWRTVENVENEKHQDRQAATNYLQKEARITSVSLRVT